MPAKVALDKVIRHALMPAAVTAWAGQELRWSLPSTEHASTPASMANGLTTEISIPVESVAKSLKSM